MIDSSEDALKAQKAARQNNVNRGIGRVKMNTLVNQELEANNYNTSEAIRQSQALPSHAIVEEDLAEPFKNQMSLAIDQEERAPQSAPIKVKPMPQMVSQEVRPQEDHDPSKCEIHGEELILLCLKTQDKICFRCLHSTHLLHPVVPLNSLDKLDFKTSLQREINNSIDEIKSKERVMQNNVRDSLKSHRIALRNHVMFIRDNLREEFDDFFNNLLSSIRKDWNLFTV